MKLKKIAAAVLSLTLMCGALPFSNVCVNDSAVYAEEEAEYTEGTYGVLTYKNYGDYIEISDCDESATEVDIPSEIEGVAVTHIGNLAFYDHISLLNVSIPNTVTNIGDSAFWNCSFSSITIPKSVQVIGGGAFEETPWLNEQQEKNPLVIVNDIIIDGTLCNGEVVIPDGVKVIGNRAFDYSALTSVIIPEGVTTISEGAFVLCENLSNIKIPNSVITIGYQAFYGCYALKSVEIPQNVTDISTNAFQGTYGLKTVTINNETISRWQFAQCNNLTTINLSNNVKTINGIAFSDCPFTSIVLPESVVNLNEPAFYNVPNLNSITILNPECEIYDHPMAISNGTDENDEFYYNGTIYGYENSTAQAYAEKYGYKFESLGEYVEILLGDTDGDGVVNSSDASKVLSAYAVTATGGESPLSDIQKIAADVNKDGAVDSSDASSILAYYAFTATGGEGTIEEFLG